MGGRYAPKPRSGPHKARESVPLVVLLRNRLNFALNSTEVTSILAQRHVKIDDRVRTDPKFPAGFMDVVSIPEIKKNYRLLFDTKGRFKVLEISEKEAGFKLCRVRVSSLGPGGIPVVHCNDGRTIRYPHPDIKANDTVKVDLKTGKIVSFVKFDIGNTAMVTGGHNIGRVGTITRREHHHGSFEIIHLKDAANREFATRIDNVFPIGSGQNSLVTLPDLKGIKLTIQEDRKKRLSKN